MRAVVIAALFLFTLLFVVESASEDGIGVYIIYLGSPMSGNDSLRDDHAQILNSVIRRRRNALVYHYKHGISGFAARMSAEEAKSIAQQPGVVSVFPDRMLQLHTTRSWDFLRYPDAVIDSHAEPESSSTAQEYGAIIGVLDTGIWPESESFNDKNMGPIPSHWKGTCVEGQRFNSSNCNRKIIGARFYDGDDEDDNMEYNTARDAIGHGTHVASTAAGALVPRASYYGVASGTARGGSPGSRIAVYRVCSPSGCHGSGILAGFDDAIADGVDVISVSLGTRSTFMIDFKYDPIAIGSFHAVENGITVVCSAGNEGPSSATVVNAAPWILTVAATTIDRSFEANVVLGGNQVIKGEHINLVNISDSPVHPLTSGMLAKKANGSESDARNCNPYSLEESLVKGKIVLCETTDVPDTKSITDEVKSLGGIGVIIVNNGTRSVTGISKDFPVSVISSKDVDKIISYINSTKKPVATISPTVTTTNHKPAPTIPYFSSRGPSKLAKNILKPDIAAPGVNILAAWLGNDTERALQGKPAPSYTLLSGTSMACPHVSGMASAVKARHPKFSPSAVKSAIMTTASITNNMKESITTDSGDLANAFDYGAGELTTRAPLQPGLVYETAKKDHLNFLCYYGYDISDIKAISKKVPKGFRCPKESIVDLISNINYPSMAVSGVTPTQNKTVSRTVTNVGGDGGTTYKAQIEIDGELGISVYPDELHFRKNGEKQAYQVLFMAVRPIKKEVFGSITWFNGKFKVRSPFVVNSS